MSFRNSAPSLLHVIPNRPLLLHVIPNRRKAGEESAFPRRRDRPRFATIRSTDSAPYYFMSFRNSAPYYFMSFRTGVKPVRNLLFPDAEIGPGSQRYLVPT
jgi:hypothetical protein